MDKTANVLALISSGLLAGAFAYGFFAVVPTFYEVPLEVHLTYRDALMRHNGIYVQTIMAISILAPIWCALTMDGPAISRRLCLTSSLLSVISFVITRFGNVPINRMIKTWTAAAPPPEYGRLLDRWMTFNALRTTTAALGFVCIIVATTSIKKHLPRMSLLGRLCHERNDGLIGGNMGEHPGAAGIVYPTDPGLLRIVFKASGD